MPGGLYRMSLGLWTGWLNCLDTKVNTFVFHKLPVTVTVTVISLLWEFYCWSKRKKRVYSTRIVTSTHSAAYAGYKVKQISNMYVCYKHTHKAALAWRHANTNNRNRYSKHRRLSLSLNCTGESDSESEGKSFDCLPLWTASGASAAWENHLCT